MKKKKAVKKKRKLETVDDEFNEVNSRSRKLADMEFATPTVLEDGDDGTVHLDCRIFVTLEDGRRFNQVLDLTFSEGNLEI